MNKIVNKFLLAGDKFLPEMHLKQPGFAQSACGPFTKNIDKVFNIAKNSKYGGYQRGLACTVYKFFDKKSKGSGVNIEVKHNKQLAKELHKPIIRCFKKKNSLFCI